LLQRCLGIGYGRAAKLIDFMAEDGIVGEYNGSKAREVVMTMAKWQQMQGIEADEEEEEEEEESDEENLDSDVSAEEEEDEEYEDYDEEEEEYEDESV
jgi:S-DNA-T family DNA segregation ATPase FtsK/SpoIIIE